MLKPVSDSPIENPTAFWTTIALYTFVGLCAFLFGTLVLFDVINNSYGWEKLTGAVAIVLAVGYATQYVITVVSEMIAERYSG